MNPQRHPIHHLSWWVMGCLFSELFEEKIQWNIESALCTVCRVIMVYKVTHRKLGVLHPIYPNIQKCHYILLPHWCIPDDPDNETHWLGKLFQIYHHRFHFQIWHLICWFSLCHYLQLDRQNPVSLFVVMDYSKWTHGQFLLAHQPSSIFAAQKAYSV